MKPLFAVLRLVVAFGGIIAIVATFFDTASRAAINPFNFFGYFTMQSNILFIVSLLLSGLVIVAGRKQSALLQLFRGCTTTYIVIVGIVYNTLLVGLEGGISLEWANWVLHVALPIYAAIDWIFFSDRGPLPWSKLWYSLIYPIVWLVVVLIRGATDGWVPYPFLSPTLGYGVVALYCLAIAAATIVVASLVWALSRVKALKA